MPPQMLPLQVALRVYSHGATPSEAACRPLRYSGWSGRGGSGDESVTQLC